MMATEQLAQTRIDSPVGELTVVANSSHLLVLTWGDSAGSSKRVSELIGQAELCAPADHVILGAASSQLAEYFAGSRREFDLPLMAQGTAFQMAAWEVLQQIPYGETLNYARQAERAGSPKGSRAVGSANGRNPIAIIIPCHRVIGADGSLTGFGGGIDTKRWLLDHEQRVLGISGQLDSI
jgi:methylated-DNA-[protein]-cysteine S-methyltransferase